MEESPGVALTSRMSRMEDLAPECHCIEAEDLDPERQDYRDRCLAEQQGRRGESLNGLNQGS